ATPHLYTLSLHDALPISIAPYTFFQGLPATCQRKSHCVHIVSPWVVCCKMYPLQIYGNFQKRWVVLSSTDQTGDYQSTQKIKARSEEHTSELQSQSNLVC